jgi:hypothetical protein
MQTFHIFLAGEVHEDPLAWIEGVAILVCVAIVVLVTALNDYTKERQFRGFSFNYSSVEDNHTNLKKQVSKPKSKLSTNLL